jgi:hypothetical protein
MSIPSNKIELLEQICFELERLQKTVQNIPFDAYHLVLIQGHKKDSLINLHQLLSYLIGWSQLVLIWKDASDKDIEIEMPTKGFKWNELGKLAEKFYADYSAIDSSQLLKKYEEQIHAIIGIINNERNETLYEKKWYKEHTLGRMIQLNTSSPMKNAILKIRKFKKSQRID